MYAPTTINKKNLTRDSSKNSINHLSLHFGTLTLSPSNYPFFFFDDCACAHTFVSLTLFNNNIKSRRWNFLQESQRWSFHSRLHRERPSLFFFFVVLYHEPILITGTADKVTRERHRIHTTTLVQTTAAVFTQKTKITIRPFWIERTHERTSLRDDGSLANESEIVFWYPSRLRIKNELGIVRQRQCAQRCGEREWIDRFRGWVNCEQQLNAGWEKWRCSLCALRRMLNGSFLVLRRWCVEWREKNTGTFCLFVLI